MADYHERALKLSADGNWDGSHREIQPYCDDLSCLIHGYLHRVEGDLDNAAYWYRRAGACLPENTLDEEWQRLSAAARSAPQE